MTLQVHLQLQVHFYYYLIKITYNSLFHKKIQLIGFTIQIQLIGFTIQIQLIGFTIQIQLIGFTITPRLNGRPCC
jgi:hypothetical protein